VTSQVGATYLKCAVLSYGSNETFSDSFAQGFPTWGACAPRGTFPYLKGTFKVGNRREMYISMLFISNYLYIYQRILFSKIIICSLLNISVDDHDQIFCQKKF